VFAAATDTRASSADAGRVGGPSGGALTTTAAVIGGVLTASMLAIDRDSQR
jgi:hypothetical protein